MLENAWKSVIYFEVYSKTAGLASKNIEFPSMLEHVRKSMRRIQIYSKTAPSHAARWQKTTNFLAY